LIVAANGVRLRRIARVVDRLVSPRQACRRPHGPRAEALPNVAGRDELDHVLTNIRVLVYPAETVGVSLLGEVRRAECIDRHASLGENRVPAVPGIGGEAVSRHTADGITAAVVDDVDAELPALVVAGVVYGLQRVGLAVLIVGLPAPTRFTEVAGEAENDARGLALRVVLGVALLDEILVEDAIRARVAGARARRNGQAGARIAPLEAIQIVVVVKDLIAGHVERN